MKYNAVMRNKQKSYELINMAMKSPLSRNFEVHMAVPKDNLLGRDVT
jgi:hypothetical protein